MSEEQPIDYVELEKREKQRAWEILESARQLFLTITQADQKMNGPILLDLDTVWGPNGLSDMKILDLVLNSEFDDRVLDEQDFGHRMAHERNRSHVDANMILTVEDTVNFYVYTPDPYAEDGGVISSMITLSQRGAGDKDKGMVEIALSRGAYYRPRNVSDTSTFFSSREKVPLAVLTKDLGTQTISYVVYDGEKREKELVAKRIFV